MVTPIDEVPVRDAREEDRRGIDPCTSCGLNVIHAVGLCRTCYMRKRSEKMPPCTVDGCERRQHANGYCPSHSTREWQQRTGNVPIHYPRTAIAIGPCVICATLLVRPARTLLCCDSCRPYHERRKRRKWKYQNVEKWRASDSNSRKRNRETHNQNNRNRRHMQGQQRVTLDQAMAIRAAPCTACGLPGPSTVDHIHPLSRGGTHTIDNLQPLCHRCNTSKHAKTMDEWRDWHIREGRPWPPIAKDRAVTRTNPGSTRQIASAGSAEDQVQTPSTTSGEWTKAEKTSHRIGGPHISDATRQTEHATSTRSAARCHVIAKRLKRAKAIFR